MEDKEAFAKKIDLLVNNFINDVDEIKDEVEKDYKLVIDKDEEFYGYMPSSRYLHLSQEAKFELNKYMLREFIKTQDKLTEDEKLKQLIDKHQSLVRKMSYNSIFDNGLAYVFRNEEVSDESKDTHKAMSFKKGWEWAFGETETFIRVDDLVYCINFKAPVILYQNDGNINVETLITELATTSSPLNTNIKILEYKSQLYSEGDLLPLMGVRGDYYLGNKIDEDRCNIELHIRGRRYIAGVFENKGNNDH